MNDAIRKFALSTLALAAGCASLSAKSPNILFILADDMGWQDTSVQLADRRTPLNDRFHTPEMQRLADEGMKFTQAYATSVCTPSRVSFLTGYSPASHHVSQWTYLSGDHPASDLEHPTLSFADWNWNGLQPTDELPHSITADTLPHRLQRLGYRTMIFGKGHLGTKDTPGADPLNLGFDIRVGGRFAGGPGSYSGLDNFASGGNLDSPWRAWDLDEYFGQDIHLSEALTQKAAAEIRAAVADEQPFFVYLAHYAPHTPIQPDERFAPAYRAEGLDETEAAYASLVAGVDKSVGDMLDLLDELNITDDTIVVFMSDNGGMSHSRRGMEPPHTHNAPLSSGKGSHHEGGIRVPLMVRWPGQVPASTANSTPVMIYDWFATLLDAANDPNPPPAGLDALSLIPLLQNKPATKAFDRPLVWHFPHFWGPLHLGPVEGPGMGACSVIRDGDWKLIYYHADRSFELFNLRKDLGETKNLASAKPKRVETLAKKLSDYLRERDAPMPIVKATGHPVPMPDASFAK